MTTQDDLDRFLKTQHEVAWNSNVDAPERHSVTMDRHRPPLVNEPKETSKEEHGILQ